MRCFLVDDPASYRGPKGVVRPPHTRHWLTQEGADLIYGAYEHLYGTGQSREVLMRRGGLFASEVNHFIEKKALPQGFDWKQYIDQ